MNLCLRSVYRGSLAVWVMALLIPWVSSTQRLNAGDWPQFLGPERNGVATGETLAETYPKEGPPKLWQKKIGQGFSSPIVCSNRVIIANRVGDEEWVECLDALSGKSIWISKSPTAY